MKHMWNIEGQISGEIQQLLEESEVKLPSSQCFCETSVDLLYWDRSWIFNPELFSQSSYVHRNHGNVASANLKKEGACCYWCENWQIYFEYNMSKSVFIFFWLNLVPYNLWRNMQSACQGNKWRVYVFELISKCTTGIWFGEGILSIVQQYIAKSWSLHV